MSSPIRSSISPDNAAAVLPILEAISRQLRELSEKSGQPAQRYLTIADAGAYTGLSQESIRRLISARKLTVYRPVRGRLLVDRQELDAVIRASTTSPRNSRGRVRP